MLFTLQIAIAVAVGVTSSRKTTNETGLGSHGSTDQFGQSRPCGVAGSNPLLCNLEPSLSLQ